MSAAAKPRPATHPVVLTANRLRDGRVVWLGEAGRWVADVAEAHPFAPEAGEEGLAQARRAEQERLVVGAYAVEVALGSGGPSPLRFRERLRATGPSVLAGPAPRLASAA